MSNAIFPTLAGLSWSFIKSPTWSTKVQRATSGKEYRNAFFSQPIYNITKVYDVLRADLVNAELQTLVAFFNARQGSYDNFLVNDTTDNSVTTQSIGTGNGVATQFQLVRSYGGNNELVANVNTITGIYDNGSPVAQGAGAGKYTIDSYGLVTFGTAPVAGHGSSGPNWL